LSAVCPFNTLHVIPACPESFFFCFPYCPIRKISVERRGTRVKRFFVSEARRAELKNLTESRWSETPGDWMRLSNARSFFINNHVLACRSHVIIRGSFFGTFLH
jgi:hypothetical protein